MGKFFRSMGHDRVNVSLKPGQTQTSGVNVGVKDTIDFLFVGKQR